MEIRLDEVMSMSGGLSLDSPRGARAAAAARGGTATGAGAGAPATTSGGGAFRNSTTSSAATPQQRGHLGSIGGGRPFVAGGTWTPAVVPQPSDSAASPGGGDSPYTTSGGGVTSSHATGGGSLAAPASASAFASPSSAGGGNAGPKSPLGIARAPVGGSFSDSRWGGGGGDSVEDEAQSSSSSSRPSAGRSQGAWQLVRLAERTPCAACDGTAEQVTVDGGSDVFTCDAVLDAGTVAAVCTWGGVSWTFCPDPLCVDSQPAGVAAAGARGGASGGGSAGRLLPRCPACLPLRDGVRLKRSEYAALLAVGLDVAAP